VEKRQSATITVLATPEQAKIITGLDHDGIAHVALICRNNDKLTGELLETQDVILQEMYYPVEEPDNEDTEPEKILTADWEGYKPWVK